MAEAYLLHSGGGGARAACGSFTGTGACTHTITGLDFTPTKFILLCASSGENGGPVLTTPGGYYDGTSGCLYRIGYWTGYIGNVEENRTSITVGDGTVTLTGYTGVKFENGILYRWMAMAE